MILSQPVFALSPYCCLLNREATNTNFKSLWFDPTGARTKMATGRNFSMSGINSGHHNLPTYEISLKSNNVEFVQYCGGHFENGDR